MFLLFSLLRADFLERTRRYSFLITLGLVLWLGYLCANGTITLRLGNYHGVFNSAWVGSMMALVVNTFLSLFGFYVIKNAVERDRQTGVGQILATTPLSRVHYVLGKWLSNLAVLGVMVLILLGVALGLQLAQPQAQALDWWALGAPFLLITLPMMALVAATAVMFEVVPFLRGSLGNVVYFFGWNFAFVSAITLLGAVAPALDPTGLSLFQRDMQQTLWAFDPGYEGGFVLGVMPPENALTFVWPGVQWTLEIVAARLGVMALAVGVALGAALLFDRFAETPKPIKTRAKTTVVAEPATLVVPPPPLHLSPIVRRFDFLALWVAELRLLLKGQRWWWYAGAVLFNLLPLLADADIGPMLVALAAIWPLAVWSALGAREQRYNTLPLMASAPGVSTRQLAVTWLAGVGVSALLTVGVGASLAAAGNTSSLFTWAVSVGFIPVLALALGAWTGSPKAFEVVYVVLWYVGLLNNVPELNFITGPLTTGLVFAGLTLGLLAATAVRRQQQS